MKLTCCCGASIEVENPLHDLNHTELNGEPQLVEFKRVHAPCLIRWREKAVFVPMYTVHCDSSGQEMFRRCTTCHGIIKPPSIPYHKGMVLCGCGKPDDGFDKWWNSFGCCMTNDKTPHEMAWHDGFLAGREAKQTFDQWIDGMSSDTLRNALNVDYVARCTVRALWEAANR